MRLAIMGAGTVGSSVARMAAARDHRIVAFADSSGAILNDAGIDVETAVRRKADGEPLGSADVAEAVEAEYDALVEATPTVVGDAEPGVGHVERALERDRHVVLANKGPVAEQYGDVRRAERRSDGRLLFEATVGGPIPILSTIRDLGPETVTNVFGILNGTTNFVLSKMVSEGVAFREALDDAQERGVAEADPTMDVEGIDSGLKAAILANVLADGLDGVEFTLDDVRVEGIRGIGTEAVELVRDTDYTVRLVVEATVEEAVVKPRVLEADHPLAVPGTRNVVQLRTAEAGHFTLSGRGAGGRETALAVLADVQRLARL